MSIPRDAEKLGLPCPECTQHLGAATDSAPATADCCLCQSTHTTTVLWDGNAYCHCCITAVSPALLAAALIPVLAEELPYRVPEIATRAFWYMVRLVVGFAAFWGVLAAIASGIRDGAWFFGIWLLCGIPVILLWTSAASIALPLMKTKTMAWRGKLIVRLGSGLLVAQLTDISWRDGVMSEHTIWKFSNLLRGPSLIVELPKSVSPEGNCVAVGCTPDAMEVWRAFFTISKVPIAQNTQSRR